MLGDFQILKKIPLYKLTLIFLVLILVTYGCGEKTSLDEETQAGIEKIEDAKTLVVGTCADYPPYEFRLLNQEDGDIVGIDIDIANEIAKELGAKLEIKDIIFSDLFKSLEQGEVDIINITADITKKVHQCNLNDGIITVFVVGIASCDK